MFLGRLIRATGPQKLTFIRINWLTQIFVVGNIFCFLVQAAGAGSLVNADTSSSVTFAEIYLRWPIYGLDVVLMAVITAVTLSWCSVNVQIAVVIRFL
jgi:hypothetical protein